MQKFWRTLRKNLKRFLPAALKIKEAQRASLILSDTGKETQRASLIKSHDGSCAWNNDSYFNELFLFFYDFYDFYVRHLKMKMTFQDLSLTYQDLSLQEM